MEPKGAQALTRNRARAVRPEARRSKSGAWVARAGRERQIDTHHAVFDRQKSL